MKIVDNNLTKLKEEISQTLLLEKKDNVLQKLISERDFFREHALFLNSQNNGFVTRFNRKA